MNVIRIRLSLELSCTVAIFKLSKENCDVIMSVIDGVGINFQLVITKQ